MAVGEIIGASIGILMLIIVAYLVVGSTLSTAELVTNTQKEVTQQNEARLNTNIRISDAKYCATTLVLTFNITNTGNEIIGNFPDMDVYVINPAQSPVFHANNQSNGYGTDATKTWKYSQITWSNGAVSSIHLNQLDPGEMMWGEIDGPFASKPLSGSEVLVVTPNGIKGSMNIDIPP